MLVQDDAEVTRPLARAGPARRSGQGSPAAPATAEAVAPAQAPMESPPDGRVPVMLQARMHPVPMSMAQAATSEPRPAPETTVPQPGGAESPSVRVRAVVRVVPAVGHHVLSLRRRAVEAQP